MYLQSSGFVQSPWTASLCTVTCMSYCFHGEVNSTLGQEDCASFVVHVLSSSSQIMVTRPASDRLPGNISALHATDNTYIHQYFWSSD